MRLLIANANTSPMVTEIVARAARGFAAPQTELTLATAAFGGQILASRSEIAIAQHAILDAIARHGGDCDGVLIAASYDCGLQAVRELTGKPAAGLTEASLMAAMTVGARLGLAIWGQGATALHREVIEACGFGGRICGVRRVDAALPWDDASAARMDAATIAAARALVEADEADVVLLLGAAFAGRSLAVERHVGAPVLDGVRCAIPLLEAMVRIKPKPPLRGSFALPPERRSLGLSVELARALARGDEERDRGEREPRTLS